MKSKKYNKLVNLIKNKVDSQIEKKISGYQCRGGVK